MALAVVALLTLHGGLEVNSLLREAPTVDEVIHLPAGITYWQTGTFKLYPHNPPLIRLAAALPVVASGPETDRLYKRDPRRPWAESFWEGPYPNKAGFAHEFAYQNAARYFELFARARLVMPVFSVFGGWLVFAWSRRLYGDRGGLLSLALWTLCPNILAHGRLVTTDLGATVLGFGATYAFWRFLHQPTWGRAVLAGIALGVAELAKFSMLLLYGLWPVLWVVHEWLARSREGRLARLGRFMVQAVTIVALSVLTIDLGYGFEGVGTPLGRFEFVSQTLARPEKRGTTAPSGRDDLLNLAWSHRVNRFRVTLLADLPSPLPSYYLIGFDLQKLEADGIPKLWGWRPGKDPRPRPDEVSGYPVYLDGQLRETSWWYYYVLALIYKGPEGTLILLGLSMADLLATRRSRAAWADELTLLIVPGVVLGAMSFGTNINLGLRYVLPIFPYLFVSAGKLAPWVSGMAGARRRVAIGVVSACLAATAIATLSIHPHYLAYFNRASGGPARGSEHLIDSNLDWGQELVGLRQWAARNAPGERVGVAYFGQINPELFNLRGEEFDWFLPPALPGHWNGAAPRSPGAGSPPPPGLYAVSVSLIRGLPWRVYDRTRWAPYEAKQDAFAYFQELTPFDHIGHSIFLYRIDGGDAERLARHWVRVPE